MRICLVINSPSIYIERWVKYFVDEGHEVHLISNKPFDSNRVRNAELYVLSSIPPKIRVISLLINIIWSSFQMKKLVRKIKPDILNAHYITNGGFIAALSGFHPLIVSAWGSDVFVDPFVSSANRYRVRFALNKADLVTTTAQYTTDYVHREFNVPFRKIKMLHWGIDTNVFQKGYSNEVKILRKALNIDDHTFIVLSPRTMVAHYRIESIVKSIPYVIKKHTNVCFVFLKGSSTDSSYADKIQTIAEDLGVKEYTRFVSKFLELTEMAIYDNMCDALVSIPRTDQFASCIVEGVSCGAIPILGNLELYREYLTDMKNAFFVDGENPSDIAEKVIYCIEHPEVKEGFYRLNREIVEKDLDWNKNAHLMYEFYLDLLKGDE